MKAPYADLGPAVDAEFVAWLNATAIIADDLEMAEMMARFLVALGVTIQ
jgi:hypothetical protein